MPLPHAGKYCEFAKLFGEEKFIQAGSLLVELLEAGVVPKRYIVHQPCDGFRIYCTVY